MPIIIDYAKRFGIYDDLLPVLSMSLGAGETTLMRLATGYCMLANGGKPVNATLIDRIQDRWGHTIWRHDQRVCESCKADAWQNQEEPEISDDRPQIIDPHTAYQMTSILEGVIQRGTATVLKSVGRPLAGKTGTTNEEKDAWFIGYSPDLVVGVFVGYDTPTPMGKFQTGGKVAAPIFGAFMQEALADTPPAPFRVPPGHQARARQPAHRPARLGRRPDQHHGSVQAGRGARRRLFRDRLHGVGGRRRTTAGG